MTTTSPTHTHTLHPFGESVIYLLHSGSCTQLLESIHGSPLSQIVFSAGTMYAVPGTDRSLIPVPVHVKPHHTREVRLPQQHQQQQQQLLQQPQQHLQHLQQSSPPPPPQQHHHHHPHPLPLRTHIASHSLFAPGHLTPLHHTHSPPPATTSTLPLFGPARQSGGREQGRKPFRYHSRSAARTSIDISEFHVPELPPPIHPTSAQGFRNHTNRLPIRSPSHFTFPSSSSSFSPPPPPPKDHPVIPLRRPLRPAVSFGAVSHHSYDSTCPIVEKPTSHPERKRAASMEPRSIKPAWNQRLHNCFSCCFAAPPSP